MGRSLGECVRGCVGARVRGCAGARVRGWVGRDVEIVDAPAHMPTRVCVCMSGRCNATSALARTKVALLLGLRFHAAGHRHHAVIRRAAGPCLSVRLSVHPSPPSLHSSIRPSVHPSVCSCMCRSICISSTPVVRLEVTGWGGSGAPTSVALRSPLHVCSTAVFLPGSDKMRAR